MTAFEKRVPNMSQNNDTKLILSLISGLTVFAIIAILEKNL
jgi:hypothetical protein